MTPQQIKNFAFAMTNIDRDELEDADVMKPHQVGGSDWKRFTDDPMMFVIKLPADKLEKLAELVTKKISKFAPEKA